MLLLELGDGRVQGALVHVGQGETRDAVAGEGDGCLLANAYGYELKSL